MSKIAEILKIIEAGGHVAGPQPLHAYHAAKTCRDSARCKDLNDTFRACRLALKNYRVRVELEAGYVRISTFDRSQMVSL